MTILSEKIVSIPLNEVDSTTWMITVVFFGFLFLFLICIAASAKVKFKGWAFLISIFILIGVFIYQRRPEPQQYYDYKQYDVLIDETVTFHEVMDNYDLIKNEGLIYTIREKTPENGD